MTQVLFRASLYNHSTEGMIVLRGKEYKEEKERDGLRERNMKCSRKYGFLTQPSICLSCGKTSFFKTFKKHLSFKIIFYNIFKLL